MYQIHVLKKMHADPHPGNFLVSKEEKLIALDFGCTKNLPDEFIVRNTGSAALDLAYVASGRYDGYWHREINYWDIAAGLILVKESGGFVESLNGKGFLEKKIDIIATNSKIHKELRNLL